MLETFLTILDQTFHSVVAGPVAFTFAFVLTCVFAIGVIVQLIARPYLAASLLLLIFAVAFFVTADGGTLP